MVTSVGYASVHWQRKYALKPVALLTYGWLHFVSGANFSYFPVLLQDQLQLILLVPGPI